MLALKGQKKLPECMALAGFTEEEVANRSLQQRLQRLKEKMAEGKVPSVVGVLTNPSSAVSSLAQGGISGKKPPPNTRTETTTTLNRKIPTKT